MVSRIVTNQMLWKAPPSDDVIADTQSATDTIPPGHHDVTVLFDLSSLLCKSRCLVLMMSAFCSSTGKCAVCVCVCVYLVVYLVVYCFVSMH